MGWDALTAIGTAVAAVFVVVDGAIALYQLREGRRASQFDATQRMVDKLLAPDFNAALRFVIADLPGRLSDPQYRSELETSRGWDVDPERRPELLVLARRPTSGFQRGVDLRELGVSQ